MGTPTTNLKLHKPPWTAGGTEVTLFAAGLDNVETRHSAEVFYGDANYTDLASIVAATNTTIHIPPGSNVSVSAHTNFPTSSTVVMHPNSEFTVSASTVLYIPNCICLGAGPFFSIGADAKVIFGQNFKAGSVEVFEGAGLNNAVHFGIGPEILASTDFSTGWTDTSDGWSIAGGVATAVSAEAAETVSATPATLRAGQFYCLVNVSTYTSGKLQIHVQNVTQSAITGAGMKEYFFDCSMGSTAQEFYIGGTDAGDVFSGEVNYVSLRKVIGSNLSEVDPAWWGAVPDGITYCADAIQYALNACAGTRGPVYSGVYGSTRTPKRVKYQPGSYVIEAGPISVPAHVQQAGTDSNTVLFIGDPADFSFSGNIVFSFAEIYTVKTTIFSDLIVNATYSVPTTPANPFIYLKFTATPGAGAIKNNEFHGGSGATDTIALWLDDTAGANYDCMRITDNYFGNVNTDVYGAVYGRCLGGDLQNMVIDRNTFFCDGINFNCSCVNSSFYDNLVEPTTNNARLIKARTQGGVAISSITKGTTTALVFSAMDPALALSGGNPVANQSLFLTGFAGDLAVLNGLHQVKTDEAGSSTGCSVNVDTSGCSDTDITGTKAEYVGGYIPIFLNDGRNAWHGNYIDYTGFIYIMGGPTQNTNSLGGWPLISGFGFNPNIFEINLLPTVAGIDNAGPLPYTAGENYAGTYVSATSFTVEDAHSTTLIANSRILIYQEMGGHIYGLIPTEILTATYNGGTELTTVVLTEGILVSGATIYAFPMLKYQTSSLAFPSGYTDGGAGFADGHAQTYGLTTEKLKVGSARYQEGSVIHSLFVQQHTCGTETPLAGATTVTLSVALTNISDDAAGSKYSVICTAPVSCPDKISIQNCCVNTQMTYAYITIRNNHASEAWDYSNTVWNLTFLRGVA